MPPDLKNILDKAFNNCQELHKCQLIFQEIKHMKDDLNLAKKFISGDKLEPFDIFLNQAYSKEFEEQNRLKEENANLKNQYTSQFKDNLKTNYTTPDNTEVSVEDLFNCNISKIPHVKTPSGSANSSRTSNNQSVSVNANSPKSAPINSSKSAINSQKPAVPYSKNPVSTLKPNVPQKPLTKNSGKKVTFGINNTQPPVTKKTQVNNNNKNTNTAQNGQASSAAFNKNKELIKSVMGKMNRQADDFQSRPKFKPIANSQKNMTQTLEELFFEAKMLNDNIIISEMTKITNIIDNMHTIVKMRKGKLEKIFETIDTEGLLSRQGDIIKNLNYLQKKYPSLFVPGDTDILNMEMPSDFVSGKSNWDAIKKGYIELKYLEKDSDKVNSKISNEIANCRRETEEIVNRNLQDQLKPMIDIYSNRAKTMDNNNMFAIKVLTFIKKLNFTSLGLDEYFNEMASSAEDNHIKKYANNSKVTYNDDYLINFNQKYPKNIHDDSNIDRNTISKGPSNLNSLSFSSRAVSFQKSENKQTNNVADKSNPAAPTPSGSSKSVSKTSSPPVAAGSNKKNKNKDAPDKKSAATVSTAKSTLTDKPPKKSTTNTSGTVKSASVSTKTPGKDNKALDLSDIDGSLSKSSKILDKLIEKVNSYQFAGRPFSDVVYDNLKNIKPLKGLAEKIMEQYYEKFDKLYTNPDEKRYIKLDMQINNIHNKYQDFVSIGVTWGYSDLESVPKPSNFTGTDADWNNFKSDYKKLNNEYNTLSSKLYSEQNNIYLKKQDLDKQTESELETGVISQLGKIKSDLDAELSHQSLSGNKDILNLIIKYVEDLIKKYSNFSRNFSKIYSIKDDPTKKMWKFAKRK